MLQAPTRRRPLPRLMDKSLMVASPPRRSRGQKIKNIGAPHGRSKRIKKTTAECALAAPSPCGGQLFVTDFDQSRWEIMYPHFVEEGLVDPCNRANKKNV
jgi:hypothetical protein